MNDERILNFFRWVYSMKFEAGLCYFEGEFHINITCKNPGPYSNLICSATGKTPFDALDSALKTLRNLGIA